MNKRGSLAITQILILIIGILAFSYMLGEIGKSQGIEVSRGVEIVSAQALCGEQGEILCDPGKICNKNENFCEDPVEVTIIDPSGKRETQQVPESEANKGEKGVLDYMGYISQGYSVYKIGQELLGGAEAINEISPIVDPVHRDMASRGGKDLATESGKAKFISFTGEGTPFANWFGSFAAALGTALLIYQIFSWAGAGQANLQMIENSAYVGVGIGVAASVAAAAASTAATAAVAAGTYSSLAAFALSNPIGWVAAAVTAVFMIIWTFIGYQDYVAEIITYKINAWQASDGGANCEKCNKLEFGCTEYQCKTFGAGCEIVNSESVQRRCIWINPDDNLYPVITENTTISLLPQGYSYKKSTEISPPDTGVEITSGAEKCIPPFTSLVLGVTTDESAHCKISNTRNISFENMARDMDEGPIKIEDHTIRIPHSAIVNDEILQNLLDTSALPEGVEFEISNDNEYEYYIKCKDPNGNTNPANFAIKFCVQDKDLVAPIIIGFFVNDGTFSPQFGSLVHFDTASLETEVWTNEPAECKWDFQDKTYGDMQETMTNCDTTLNQADNLGRYSCSANFTGLANGQENKYYIRCQDRSADKNTNAGSTTYTLKPAAQTLLIDSVTVNNKENNSIIKSGRSDRIPADLKVATSFGAEDGKAKCFYEYLGYEVQMALNYIQINAVTAWLPGGEYTLPIRCEDRAGNQDSSSITFTLVTDRDAPIAARAYYDVNNLKVITNEPAECVYTTQQNIACDYNFDDGTAMNEIGEATHYTPWQANKKYFIKCKDAFGNQPLPGQCSIIVKAFESFK